MNNDDLIRSNESSQINRYIAIQLKSKSLIDLYGEMAQGIVDVLKPGTVLDFGCDSGALVSELRNRGILAFGMDRSAEAVSKAELDVRKFLTASPAITSAKELYDLIICTESYVETGSIIDNPFVESICQHTDTVLFFLTGNLRTPSSWARIFADYGFYHDLDRQIEVISPCCVLFRKGEMSKSQIIYEYERVLWQSLMEIRSRRSFEVDTHFLLTQKEAESILLEMQHHAMGEHIAEIYSSRAWKLAQSLRRLREFLIPPDSRREKMMKSILGRMFVFG